MCSSTPYRTHRVDDKSSRQLKSLCNFSIASFTSMQTEAFQSQRITLPILILIVFLGFKGLTQNSEWTIASSTVSFKIKNAGFSVDGKFGSVSGTIIFDELKGFGNSVDVSIDAKTISTGNSSRDGHLKKDEYFGVDKYPKIQMKAVLFSKNTDGTFKGFFKLTLKDKTKDVMVPFSFSQKDGKGVFKGSFTINRLDYSVGESSMILSDNALVTIEVNILKK